MDIDRKANIFIHPASIPRLTAVMLWTVPFSGQLLYFMGISYWRAVQSRRMTTSQAMPKPCGQACRLLAPRNKCRLELRIFTIWTLAPACAVIIILWGLTWLALSIVWIVQKTTFQMKGGCVVDDPASVPRPRTVLASITMIRCHVRQTRDAGTCPRKLSRKVQVKLHIV